MAYIYSIRKNGKGYIGLASGAAEYADYGRRLRAPREKLDRMLQHIDNAYKIESSYGAATETSEGLDNALKGGAYLCNFSYNDDNLFGLPEESYKLFSSFWKSSQSDARMNFAEFVYIYLFRNDYAQWNSMWGSQGNFKLKHTGFLKRYPAIEKNEYLKQTLKKVCDSGITWGAPSNGKDVSVLQSFFWPENLIAQPLSKAFSLDLLTLQDYRDTLYEVMKNADVKVTKKELIITGNHEDAFKKLIKRKRSKIEKALEALAKMGFKVKAPSDDDICLLLSKISTVLKSDSKQASAQKTVEIPNIITIEWESSPKGDPDWMPTNISLPGKDATDGVKIHCVNRCYEKLKTYSEDANETRQTIEFYSTILGDRAQEFVEQVQTIAAKDKNSGSLYVFESTLNSDSSWVAFGRDANKGRKLFWAPRDQMDAILEADQVYEVESLTVY